MRPRLRRLDPTLTGAVFGGGAGMVGFGWGLLRVEAKLARRAIPILGEAPMADGMYGAGPGYPVRMAMVGDSAAAGVGTEVAEETPGAMLATAVSVVANAPVLLDVLAVSGSTSADLDPQVSRALLNPPDVAVLSIGANDITHKVSIDKALAAQRAAVERLVAAGVAVVVGTCPDLGAIRPIPQPLRAYAGRRTRQMAAAQQLALDACGARVVPLAAMLADRFYAEPEVLFCRDRFHPSAAGYRLFVDALLPTVLTALGLEREATAGGGAEAPV